MINHVDLGIFFFPFSFSLFWRYTSMKNCKGGYVPKYTYICIHKVETMCFVGWEGGRERERSLPTPLPRKVHVLRMHIYTQCYTYSLLSQSTRAWHSLPYRIHRRSKVKSRNKAVTQDIGRPWVEELHYRRKKRDAVLKSFTNCEWPACLKQSMCSASRD